MSTITDPKIRAFLTEGTRTGKLSFLSAGGRPLVTPVWFVLEGDSLIFNTGKDTAKGRALATGSSGMNRAMRSGPDVCRLLHGPPAKTAGAALSSAPSAPSIVSM